MFNFFKPTCPCDQAAKAWIEERFAWLSVEFESNVFTDRPMILPDPFFFPDAFDQSESSVRTLLNRVCDYMDVPASLVTMALVPDPSNTRLDLADSGELVLVDQSGAMTAGVAGTFDFEDEKYLIRLARSQTLRPMELVGTMAHELAHARLVGEGRVSGESFDNELLTDLTVIHFGLGVFLANIPRGQMCRSEFWPGTSLLMPNYMTPPLHAYALAHVAWFADDRKPTWARRLEWGARANLRQAINYVFKTGDSTFKPFHLRDR